MRESFSREQMQSGVLVSTNPYPFVQMSGPFVPRPASSSLDRRKLESRSIAESGMIYAVLSLAFVPTIAYSPVSQAWEALGYTTDSVMFRDELGSQTALPSFSNLSGRNPAYW